MSKTKDQPSRAELLAYVRETFLFKDLEEEVAQELSHDISWVRLGPGENLFRQGDETDSAYVLIGGRLKVAIPQDDGDELFVKEIEPGGSVGEMGVFTGKSRTASIYADSGGDAQLVKIPVSGFNRIAETNPGALLEVGETIRQCLLRDQLAVMLPNLFGDLDEQTYADIESEVEWVQVSTGDIILREGDPGDGMYILIRGRLKIRVKNEDGGESKMAEISPGESVGEMSLFTGEPCTADVVAVRDAVLVKFSEEVFRGLMEKYPQVTRQITKVVIGRLQRLIHAQTSTENVTNVAVIPVNPGVPVEQFTERLVAGLAKIDSTMHLSSGRVEARLGIRNISQASPGNPLNLKIAAWLDELEVANCFVVYQADAEFSEWTQRAIRNADRILIVGHAADDPAMTQLEARINRIATVRKDLVLLYPDGRKKPGGTIKWLEARDVAKHFHVRWNLDGDFERLARFIAGKAVGLCLGGGGARGFAHFGVIRTLHEAGVPIDVIGGNSMGAYVASVYATGYGEGWDIKKMIAATRKIFSRWFLHVTPPITSMVADGLLVHDIKACLSDTQIEDLWLPFFCVSSNLTRAEIKTHRRGDLWRAVRVSGGLPGIVPPLVFDGDLHVDGALLDNLPVDVMSRACDGGEVIAIDVSPIVDMSENKPYGDSLSGWDIVFRRLNPFAENVQIPNMLTIIQRSAEIGGVLQLKGVVDKLADVYIPMPVEHFDILEFGSAEKIVQVGYTEAQRRIIPWLKSREAEEEKKKRS